jgi:hypothetical protein
MLTRLIYFSENDPTVSIDTIRAILKTANEYNKTNHITGLLYHNEQFFLQVLEGDRTEISKLYAKVASDDRHKNVTLVSVEGINERKFDGWNMMYINEVNVESSSIAKFLPGRTFNPKIMTNDNLKAFALYLVDFKKQDSQAELV